LWWWDKEKQNIHLLTSLRDWWSTSTNQRTTVAGRVVNENIREAIEDERAEESPFLGKIWDNYYLATSSWNFEALKWSIINYLANKYDKNDLKITKEFNLSFDDIKYIDLPNILSEIVLNNRIIQYKTIEHTDLPWLTKINKIVKIDDYNDKFYVLYNENLNTYEFKIITEFINFPEWFKKWKRPNRLYLESKNQHWRYCRISNLDNQNKIIPSWAIKKFCEIISKNCEQIIEHINLKNKNRWIFLNISCFTQWKIDDRNEDSVEFDRNNLIIVDWATDKSWIIYDWETWWEIISKIISNYALNIDEIWLKLIEKINDKVLSKYTELGIDKNDFPKIFSAAMIACKVKEDKIYITLVWDCMFRINNKDTFKNSKIIDTITSTLRKKYIESFWEENVDNARNFILPILKRQHIFQNKENIIFNEELLNNLYKIIINEFNWYNINSEKYDSIFKSAKLTLSSYYWSDLWFWMINWHDIPKSHIKIYEFTLDEVKKIEIISDWYEKFPEWNTIIDWESTYRKYNNKDPLKYKEIISTKISDDRSLIIADIKNKSQS
jgi:hypothetical protein